MNNIADGQINFSNLFKNSVLNSNLFGNISILDTMLVLIIAFLLGAFIFAVYKKSFNGVVYNNSFNISLAILVVLTAFIILTISSNIVLSLGMVGALSIVRYRTAIKDPMDLMYLFWSISTGITVGARAYSVAIIGAIFVVFSLWFFQRFTSKNLKFILVLYYSGLIAEQAIKEETRKRNCVVKSRIQRGEAIELTVEITMQNESTGFVDGLAKIEGVTDVSLIQYNGDYIG